MISGQNNNSYIDNNNNSSSSDSSNNNNNTTAFYLLFSANIISGISMFMTDDSTLPFVWQGNSIKELGVLWRDSIFTWLFLAAAAAVITVGKGGT